jgi:hypothetical protein
VGTSLTSEIERRLGYGTSARWACNEDEDLHTFMGVYLILRIDHILVLACKPLCCALITTGVPAFA